MVQPQRILILAGLCSSLVNFRGPMLRAMVKRGHEVMAAAPIDADFDDTVQALAEIGVTLTDVPVARVGLNPARDVQTYLALKKLLLTHRPDKLVAYTAKPVIYGGIAARHVGATEFYPMITGLGYAFTEGSGVKRRAVRTLVQALYRNALKKAATVIFQNPDDEALFRASHLMPTAVPSVRIHGSGVDLMAFPPAPLPEEPIFLMLARLVADKGVRDYITAARIVKNKYPNTIFRLGGGLDPNPAGIKADELQCWVEEGVIEYLGDIRPVQSAFRDCRFYVLPSYYREGTPRSVLEALATGRPVITTDAPGCRETVAHGENGLLVPPRDVDALASAMTQLIEAPQAEVQRMAYASLALAREKYDVHKVNAEILRSMGL